jgi:hypothetical protein
VFSTRAESNYYRSFGFDVIGMTSLPEAKLAREGWCWLIECCCFVKRFVYCGDYCLQWLSHLLLLILFIQIIVFIIVIIISNPHIVFFF